MPFFSMTATSDLVAVIFLMPSGLAPGRYAARQLQQQSQHRGGGGEALHEENALVDRHAGEQSGNHDAAEKKHGNFGAIVAQQQRPNEASSQKAVVQPLVHRQHFGDARLLRPLPKYAQPKRLVPEEHFEHQEIQVPFLCGAPKKLEHGLPDCYGQRVSSKPSVKLYPAGPPRLSR